MTRAQQYLRAVCEDDLQFLFELYASTRENELALTDWNDEQKHDFLQMQFQAQSSHYNEHFSRASFNLIILDGESIGRLYVDRQNDEIRIIDIALLPRYCNRGIGSGLLNELIEEAIQQSVPLRIHVEHNNPALTFYQRLGFRKVEDTGVYFLMGANLAAD